MSLTSFTADMETIGGDVPTASRFISPQISAKETHDQFPPNGLTGRNQQEVYPKVNKNMNVIVFSEPAQSSAEALQDQMKKENHSVSLLCLREPKDLKEEINLDSVSSLYMMVDASLCDILFQRKIHRGLYPDVYDFLDEVEEKGRSITLFNRMDKGDSRFKKLYHHLPEKCATMVKEITFKTGKAKKVRKRLPKSIDSGIADITPTEGPNHNSAERASDSGNKVKDAPASEQPGNSYNRNAGPGGPGGDNQEDVTSRKVSSLMASAPVGSAASPGSSGLNGDESLEGGTEVMSEDEMELEQNDNESLSEGSAESDDEPDSIVEVNTVQIGYNQTLEVQWTAGQMVNASQDGWNNTMELNIVPPATKSKVIVVFTTNPRDERLDNLLVREFTDETEVINVRVESSDASNYKVWSGSVVMEIEVKPGVTIDKEYIEKLLKVIFSGKAGKVIPEGTKFGVDIQTKMVVPFEQLGKYVHLNPEKIHENCVSKEKYEERVKEVSQLQKRLVQAMAHRSKTRAPMPLPGQQDSPSDAAPPPLPARRPPPAAPSQASSHPVHVTRLNAAEESDEDDSYEEPSTVKLNMSLQEIYDDFDDLLEDFPPSSTPPLPPPPPPFAHSRTITQESLEIYDDFEEGEPPAITPYNPVVQQDAPQELYDDFTEDYTEEKDDIYEDADDSGPEVKVLTPPSHAPPVPSMEGRRRGSQPPLPPVPSAKKELPPPPPVQGILKNPKQDQVLQKALKNFISSVLTDFAFAMTPESPALPESQQKLTESGSSQQKLPESGSSQQKLPESGSSQQKLPESVSAQQKPTDIKEGRHPIGSSELEPQERDSGLSQRVESGYGKIAPKKGSMMSYEHSGPELSPSAQTIVGHGKWQFDVLLVYLEDTHGAKSLKDFLSRHGFKCGIISSFKLREQHSLRLPHAKFVVLLGLNNDNLQLCLLHHRRVIYLTTDKFNFCYLDYLPQGTFLTFMDQRGKFWREKLLEQLGVPKEHQSPREITFDEQLEEKTYELLDSVYESEEYRPEFLVKRNGPDISIEWKEPFVGRGTTRSHGIQFSASDGLNETIVILHTHADEEFASVLKNHLQTKHGYRCSLPTNQTEISQSLEKASIVIILVSKNSLEDGMFKYMMADKVFTFHHKGGKLIVPVVLDDAIVPQTLKSYTIINVREKLWQEKLTRFIDNAARERPHHQPIELGEKGMFSNLYSPIPRYQVAAKKRVHRHWRSTLEIIEEALPELFYSLYSPIPKYIVEQKGDIYKHKGDTFTIKWTEVEEKQRRKLFTIGSQEEEEKEESPKMKKTGEESNEMRKTDVKDVRTLPQKEQMSRAKKTEVDERYDAIAGKLSRLALDMHGTHPSPKDDVPLPEVIGRELASIGDKINEAVNLEEVLEAYLRESNKAAQYEEFRSVVHDSLGSESSWRNIAMVMQATKNVLSRLGTSMAGPVRQLAQRFIEDECADFIIDQGGWEAVLDEEGSDLTLTK